MQENRNWLIIDKNNQAEHNKRVQALEESGEEDATILEEYDAPPPALESEGSELPSPFDAP